jgi:hypothetical protein
VGQSGYLDCQCRQETSQDVNNILQIRLHMHGRFLTSKLSLTQTVTPSSGPAAAPLTSHWRMKAPVDEGALAPYAAAAAAVR